MGESMIPKTLEYTIFNGVSYALIIDEHGHKWWTANGILGGEMIKPVSFKFDTFKNILDLRVWVEKYPEIDQYSKTITKDALSSKDIVVYIKSLFMNKKGE